MRAKDDRATAPDGLDEAREAGCVEASEERQRPLLLVDIDGVISLFPGETAARPGQAPAFAAGEGRRGKFHTIEGIPHFLSATAAGHLLELAEHYELVWASGWEEKANEHLPHLLGLPRLEHLSFEGRVGKANAHWKLAAIEAHAGERAMAWIDDAFNDACHAWAGARAAPTLLVETAPDEGLTATERDRLLAFAETVASTSSIG